MKKVKVGVIGLGFIGPAHMEAIRRLGCAEVTAIATTTNAQAKAEALGVENWYENWRDLLKHPGLEVVHICTPNHLHYEMAKAALESGLHVVCDKPLALTVDEAKDLVQVAQKEKRANAIHFNVRYYPLVHQIREMVQKGELGEIFAVNGSYLQDWLQLETDYSWRLEPEYSGESRAIADIGSHWCDAAEFMLGMKIERVMADFATFHPIRKRPLKNVTTYSGMLLKPEDYEEMPVKTEDYASVLMKFENGVHGSFIVNQAFAGRKNRIYFEICGSKASVTYDTERPNELWIGSREGSNKIMLKDPALVYPAAQAIIGFPGGHCEGFPDTSKQLFRQFYTYVIKKGYETAEKPEFPTFEDGLRELELCECIVKSSRQEKWLSVY